MAGDNASWANNTGVSKGLLPGRATLGPLLLIMACPPFVILLWLLNTKFEGDMLAMWGYGLHTALIDHWPSPWNPAAWQFIGYFAGSMAVLDRVVPGKRFEGPVTPAGNVPVYRDNGIYVYLIALVGFVAGARLEYYNGGIIYDVLGDFLSAMNIFSLIFCLLLYIKGCHWPSSTDSGTTGNFVKDYFVGTELYPRILGWDVKTFTNCRFGMQFWALALVSYAMKQEELHGHITDSMFVSVCLQLVYITKFYWWESGYWTSIDIMHDRAGFYICWGCLAFLPCVYTSPTMFMVERPVDMGPMYSFGCLALGWLCVWSNYDCDRQRFFFRLHKGQAMIWGHMPNLIVAKYKTETGETRESLLLVDGWWKIARHYHYLPELGAAFFWSASAGFTHFIPFFYTFPYLFLLLADRASRDDARCRSKYGKYYDQYCDAVPAKMIPGIY